MQKFVSLSIFIAVCYATADYEAISNELEELYTASRDIEIGVKAMMTVFRVCKCKNKINFQIQLEKENLKKANHVDDEKLKEAKVLVLKDEVDKLKHLVDRFNENFAKYEKLLN